MGYKIKKKIQYKKNIQCQINKALLAETVMYELVGSASDTIRFCFLILIEWKYSAGHFQNIFISLTRKNFISQIQLEITHQVLRCRTDLLHWHNWRLETILILF